MNLVDMPQVTVFLVTYVNFFDKCKLFKPKKLVTFLEKTAKATDVLQYYKKYMLINVKAVNFSVFTRGNTYKPKLHFLATKIPDW